MRTKEISVCEHCIYYGECNNQKNCKYINPITKSDDYCEKIINKLKQNLLKENNYTYLTRYPVYDRYISYNDIDCIDSNYVTIINDCLRSIRTGRVGYVFYENQLKDLLKFEPDLIATFDDGVFLISLPKDIVNKNKNTNIYRKYRN